MKNLSGLPVFSKPGIVAFKDGSVMLPSTTARMPNGGTRNYDTRPTFGTITKASSKARHKFMGIFNRKLGNMKVHILVCEAFHGPKPFPKAVVIHIDENPLNNKPTNLKWGTQKENLNMPGFIRYCKSRTGDRAPNKMGINRKLCSPKSIISPN